MSYARARLWLGISGVGTIVVIALAMIVGQLPIRMFPDHRSWHSLDFVSLIGFLVGFLILMIPFDLLGGYVLPRRHGRDAIKLWDFACQWTTGVLVQSTLFMLTAIAILAAGRSAGLAGSLSVVAVAAFGNLAVQGLLVRLTTRGVWQQQSEQLTAVLQQLEAWGFRKPRIAAVDNADIGFTGGVIGYPGFETIIVPRRWLEQLSNSQLAAAIARRVEAVQSGSRTRGMFVALFWVLSGFALSALVPGAGVDSVAGLVTLFCGYTCWLFVGLLVLPTVSRFASYEIDRKVNERGVPKELLDETAASLDRLQDDEPERSHLVETIFHPVPSVSNRRKSLPRPNSGAWHAARMTLFLSWACLGLLSRAVHCNAGRPELWVMLPAD